MEIRCVVNPQEHMEHLEGRCVVNPCELRNTLRSGVRSVMRADSQIPGRGPIDVDDALAPVNQRPNDDMDALCL